jgi:hypothetical protein
VRVVAALLVCLAAASAARAQAVDTPTCPAGVAPGGTLRAHDLESGGPLTATHTIGLGLELADGTIEDQFTLALSPGAVALRGGPTPAFRAEAPGPVSVTATWLEYDRNADSECTTSAQATFVLGPAKPPRLVAPRRNGPIGELDWNLRLGAGTDLRPVEVRLRGVRRARLPGASARVETLTLGLRRGDPARMLVGTGRVLRSAGWRFRIGPFYDGGFPIRMFGVERGCQRCKRGFGFELELFQGGRRIGRSGAVGRCEFTSFGPLCRGRVLKP